MALNENTLLGVNNKVETAIKRIQTMEEFALQNNPNGYYVCISGGKDSSVIQQLCIMAGVKCEFYHSHTTVDHPNTVYFIRSEQKRLKSMGYIFEIEYSYDKDGNRQTMWNGIAKKGFPTRIARWCCSMFKEHGGENRYCITGVRWAESVKRKGGRAIHEEFTRNKDKIMLNNDNDMKRKLSEMCMTKHKFILNPIIDWSDDEVWEFIELYNLPYNPLYDMGYKRIGCVGCPQSTKAGKELEANPTYKAMYIRAGAKYLQHRIDEGLVNERDWSTPDKYYQWWVDNTKKPIECGEQTEIDFEEMED